MVHDKDIIGMKYCSLCNMILFQIIIPCDVKKDEIAEATCPICGSSLPNSYIYVTLQIIEYVKEEAKSSNKPGISFTLTEEEKKSLGLYRISFTKIEEFKLRCFEGRLDNA